MNNRHANPAFSWKVCDAYLFDIDGTLLHTRDLVHYNALNCAMRKVYGKETTIDGVQHHGMTDPSILRAALGLVGITTQEFEAKLPQALAVVCSEVERNALSLEPVVCEAIPTLLEELSKAGKLLGVASGNLETVGWHKVHAAGLRRFFTFGVFSDRDEERAQIFCRGVALAKEQLGNQAQVCFIGDTPNDIRAARAVCAKIISACTGIYQRDDLAALQPDLCIRTCSELLQPALRR